MEIVWIFRPNFRRSVIGSSSLSDCEFVLQVLGYVQIADFGDSVMEENISWLNVSVNNIALMEGLQTL